jgi:hypothetical protein
MLRRIVLLHALHLLSKPAAPIDQPNRACGRPIAPLQHLWLFSRSIQLFCGNLTFAEFTS